MEMLVANDLPEITDDFEKVYVLDTEYYDQPGLPDGPVVPVALQAYEVRPILLRPLPEGEARTYELVAGARRYRASKLAKRESIPATVRELTDAQASELQVIENVQRVDVHPLDEAQGYAAFIQLEPDTYTVEAIAARVGRSPAYVSGRLRLIQLIPEAKQAFYEDKLTVAHAVEIARLQSLCGIGENEALDVEPLFLTRFPTLSTT
jgi:ParB/RepB/Spo0J family partition protein